MGGVLSSSSPTSAASVDPPQPVASLGPVEKSIPHTLAQTCAKKVVLKLDLHDDKDRMRVLKAVSTLPGIDSISLDMKNQKMTVIGIADPVDVVVKLSKVRVDAVRILSVGPAKEEKKDGDKKEGDSKYEDKKEGGCNQDMKKQEAGGKQIMSYPAPPPSWYVRYSEVTETTSHLVPGYTPYSEDEEDKQLTSMFTQHKVQHSSLYSNLRAIKKQWQKRGLQHTCVQQAAPQLHGRDDIRKTITDKILLSKNGGKNCTVICITSESGLGKTALLHILYNDQQLLDAFDTRIWIRTSDTIDEKTLFQKIIEFVSHVHCNVDNPSYIKEMVKEVLADRKFLLFLDDADIEDEHFWTTVLEVLSASSKESVVVIATRSYAVAALNGGATHSYCLDLLSEENSLRLLQQYASEGNDIKSNPEMTTLARQFIKRFGAKPINLRALGGLLCHTDTTLLEQKLEGNMPCLELCYHVLPKHLKDCLAFCSLFPKGYIFDKNRTVLLWLSQGYVMPTEGRELLEDIGAGYFNELVCRSFFQYSPYHDYKDEKFVMHELIYNVVVSHSDKYWKSDDLLGSIPENTLQLSLVASQFQTVQLMSKTQELKDLQTFLVVQPERQQNNISFPTINLMGLDNFFLKFTSLQTLDLSHTDIDELPGSIESLRNLQYLSLSNTSIRALPSQLCNLSNMLTLEAKSCRYLSELPRDTKKLHKLRHLEVTKDLGYVHIPNGIGQLTELQTLPVFHVSSDSSYGSMSDLGNLHSLRGRLQLAGLENVKTAREAKDANLKDKKYLQELILQWHYDELDIDIQDEEEEAENVAEQVLESLQPHAYLQELTIRCYEGGAFPAWMQDASSLPSLVSLTLDSCCNCTQFPALAQLPSLKFLSVQKMYEVQRLSEDMNVAAKFPSLELLNLWEMYGLEELFEVSEGDCPRLRKVCISRCPNLKRLPCVPVVELVLHYCHQLPDIPELASLVSLKIEGFHGVKSFNLPHALPALKKLEFRSCKELSLVHGLLALTTIQRLKIAGCPKLVLPIRFKRNKLVLPRT